MTSPREVIAEAAACAGAIHQGAMAVTIEKALADANLVIVPRPSEDRVEAATKAYSEWTHLGWSGAMAAALAAAEAADCTTGRDQSLSRSPDDAQDYGTRPRELHDELKELEEQWAAQYATTHKERPLGISMGLDLATERIAEVFNLPEANGDE